MSPSSTSMKIEIEPHPNFIFSPGQIVSGHVKVSVQQGHKPLKTSGIQVDCLGHSSVRWTERRTVTSSTGVGKNRHSTTRTVTDTFSASENHFSYTVHVFGTGESKEVIPPGDHRFPFAFTLPLGIPSSFQGAHGKVTYDIHAVMKRALFELNNRDSVPILVAGVLNLNLEPPINVREPIRAQNFKRVCCLCCQSGPIGVSMTMERGGYVPGQSLSMVTEFSNQSNRQVSRVMATLVQTVTFHSTTKSKSWSQDVATVQVLPGLPPGESESWNGIVFEIPLTLPPTRLGGCRIIDVQYTFQISMKIVRALNLNLSIPIVVGTVPLLGIQ